MSHWQAWMACGLLLSFPAAAQADILSWENGQLILGTEGITPGPRVDLSSWNSSERNLRFADFQAADLTAANFARSWLDYSRFNGADLTNAILDSAISAHADLSEANLTKAALSNSQFNGANFTNARLQSAILTNAILFAANLTNADLSGADLTDADLGGNIFFYAAHLTNANLAGAIVTGAGFSETTSRGFTKEQLYSTASYDQRNLRGIGLGHNDLTGWDFSGQDLTGASFGLSTLTSADFAGAVIAGANLSYDHPFVSGGITRSQLYSTASYQQRNLRGIVLAYNDLTGWDFSGQDLAGADFSYSQLTSANFSFADLRGASIPSGPIQLARNTIRENGAINGLDLAAGETLVVRDSDIGITVNGSMNAISGGTLELVLGDAEWGSTIVAAAGITPDLGGTLRVRFADQANLALLLGTTFDFFDWPAVLETNNRFDTIELPTGTQWDFSQLYVTGAATFTAVPEPSAALLFACGTAAWILGGAFHNGGMRAT